MIVLFLFADVDYKFLCFYFLIDSVFLWVCFFFFKQKTAYEMRISDWSSDVCSSDLLVSAVLAVKQFLTYVNGSPFQPAVATGLRLPDAFFTGIAATLRDKRDLLGAGLREAGFGVSVPSGSYFTVADAASLDATDADAFCRALPERAGVVGIPLTAFVTEIGRAHV